MREPEISLLDELTSLLKDGPADPDVQHGAMLMLDHLLCAGPATGDAPGDLAETAAGRAARAARADRDDVDWWALTHPGSVVWPVAITFAERHELSGSEIWRAAQVGYEATARIARLLGPEHRARFHPTATAGTSGATMTAAAASRIPLEETSHALGHALSVMGGSIGCVRELSETRQFHRSHAVRTGIAAAAAARAGLRSTRDDLEVGGGVLGPSAEDARRALLAPAWTGVPSGSIRVFPTSGWNQSAYEAARDAAASVRGRIEQIDVMAPPAQAAAIDTDDPWVSLRHAVVASLDVAEDDRAALRASMRVDPHAQPGVLVRMHGADGSSSARVEHPLGHPSRPLTDADLAQKWQLDPSAVSRCLDRAAELFESRRPRAASEIVAMVETLTPPR